VIRAVKDENHQNPKKE